MINSLWISKTGMEAQQRQLDVISNNLANVSTKGFKRATAVFEDLMYKNMRQMDANSTQQSTQSTGAQIGLWKRTVATNRSVAQNSNNFVSISKAGIEAQQRQLDGNPANVSTNNSKSATAVANDSVYQNLRKVGANSTEQSTMPTGMEVGLGIRTVASSRSPVVSGCTNVRKFGGVLSWRGCKTKGPTGPLIFVRRDQFKTAHPGRRWMHLPRTQ